MNDQTLPDHDPETGEILTQDAKMVPAVSPGSPVELSVVSAEINQQIATARRYPRRRDKAIAQEIMERATLNQEIARECFYALSRREAGGGSKEIIGPSIRLAEIIRASYGNIRVASRFVGIDERVKGRAVVVVEAVAMDMQTNDAVLMHVTRSIMTSPKNGQPRMFTADMVNVTMMAAQSIAQRDAILRLVPKALWIDGYQGALATVRGNETTLSDRRAKAIAAFKGFGIQPKQLFAALGIESEQEIGLDLLVHLVGMFTALKEGDSPDVVLGREAEARGTAEQPTVRSPLADRPARNGNGEPPAKQTGPALDDYGQPIAETRSSSPAQTGNTVAEKTPNTVDEAIEQRMDEARKEQKATEPRREAADASSGPAATERRLDPENEQAAGPRKETGPSGGSYQSEALAVISSSTSATKLRDYWKRTRASREQAALPSAVLDELRELYDAKLDDLRGDQ